MTDRPQPRYIHGTTREEQRRLSLLNDILNQASLRELGLRGGEKILDVGCGLAQFTRAMARAVGPKGRVLGIERSPEQLAEALRLARAAGEENLVELRQGDAVALPLREDEWGSFDVAHARFLLEHVPDPLAAVRALVRAVRPGGRVVLMDDDHDRLRLWPEPAGFAALWTAYVRSFEQLGNDPYVGRRLVALLHEAGAVPRRNASIPYVSCAGDPRFDAYTENLIAVIAGAREAVITAGLLAPAAFDDAIASLKQWRGRPDAAIWYGLCWAEGTRRA